MSSREHTSSIKIRQVKSIILENRSRLGQIFRMARPSILSTGLLAFGAGVAVGAHFSRSGRILGFVLEKLGFQLGDVLVEMWDPKEPAPSAKMAKAAKVPARRIKRRRIRKSPAAKREVLLGGRVVKPRPVARTRKGFLVTGLN
jgi:hypothetical protein